jgi:hypothetical protein
MTKQILSMKMKNTSMTLNLIITNKKLLFMTKNILYFWIISALYIKGKSPVLPELLKSKLHRL